MDTVFNAALLPRNRRWTAWIDALNSIYVSLDTVTRDDETYNGFVREAQFGPVTLTDTLLDPQDISRRRHHISRVDKDCYYVQLVQRGATRLNQNSKQRTPNLVTGTLFSASTPYELHLQSEVRALYLEVDRDYLNARAGVALPTSMEFSVGRGVGKLLFDHSLSLVAETEELGSDTRGRLGEGLIDMLALALTEPDRSAAVNSSAIIKAARLRAIKAYIRQNLHNASLSVREIAGAAEVSVRYVHLLFRTEGVTVSEYLWAERLKRSLDMLQSVRHAAMTITDIAFASGFSSSSHFSSSFKTAFGYRPSDLRRGLV